MPLFRTTRTYDRGENMSEQQHSTTGLNTVLGAGSLLSSIRKMHEPTAECPYPFGIMRMTSSCTVTQDYRPQDIVPLVRLCRLLAITYVQNGWVSPDERQLLQDLAAKLDVIMDKEL
jgi:hypothetical protein